MIIFRNSCWSKRTVPEIFLILSNIGMILFTIFLIVFFVIYMKKRDKVCYTPECTLAAARILKSINWSVHPCKDFYAMVCSVKMERKTGISRVNRKYFENDIFFNRLLLKALTNKGDTKYPMQNLPKTFFQQCTNRTLRKRFYGDFQSIIRKIIIDFDWIKTTIEARKKGLPINQFIGINIKSDVERGNKPILIIGPAFHPDNSFKKVKNIKKSRIFFELKSLVPYFNNSIFDENGVIEAIKFEQLLMQKANPVKFKNMKSYTTSQLDEKFKLKDDIKWKDFIGVEIKEPIIYVSDENYVNEVIKLGEEFDNKIMKLYMQTRLIRFANTVEDHTESVVLQDACLKHTYSQFPLILSDMYMRQLSYRRKYMVLQHVRAVKNCVDRAIRDITWMDTRTQARAHKKWSFMRTVLGYKTYILVELDKFYKNLKLDKQESFVQSYLIINKFYMNYWLNSLRSSENLISSLTPIYHLESAGYLQKRNTFVIGARYLQDVHYNRRRPDYMNFAAFGSRIAHYLIHGFDNIGKYYDYRGRLRKWWSNYSENQYNKIVQCVENKYDKYKDPRTNISIDGYFTKDTNLADISAIDLAYHAYIAWTRMYGGSHSLKLPGLNLTNAKTFWITYASSFCQKHEHNTFTNMINTENLAANKYRVNVPLTNSHNFRRDFQCQSQATKPCEMFTMEPQ